ncbi:MAG: hypothetical protein AAB729_05040, partial [Patescibacteria group bacterium]
QKNATSTPEVQVVYDEAGKELVDPPLSKQALSQSFSAKTVRFAVRDEDGADTPMVVKVILDTSTFDYRAETDIEDGFSYVEANGIVCFTKTAFKNSYCLREKYTPAVLAKQMVGEIVQARELEEDEETINRMLMEMAWSPGDILAAMMIRVENGIQFLRNNKLKDGEVIEFKGDNGKVYGTAMVLDVAYVDKYENFKTQGMHLAALMTTLYNREDKMFPYFDFQNQKTDTGFLESMKEYSIDLEKYILKQ